MAQCCVLEVLYFKALLLPIFPLACSHPSSDMLLEALVACSGVTLSAVATSLAIPITSGHVSAFGDLDFKVHPLPLLSFTPRRHNIKNSTSIKSILPLLFSISDVAHYIDRERWGSAKRVLLDVSNPCILFLFLLLFLFLFLSFFSPPLLFRFL